MYTRVAKGSKVYDVYLTDENGFFVAVIHDKKSKFDHAELVGLDEPVLRYKGDEVRVISEHELFELLMGGEVL